MDFLRSIITTGMIIGLFEMKLFNCERYRKHMLFHRHSATPYPLTPSFLRTAALANSPQIAAVRCATNDSCDLVPVSTSVDFEPEPNFVYAFKEKAIYVFDDMVQLQFKDVSGHVTVGSYFEFKVRPVGAKQFMINLRNKATKNEMLRITVYSVQTGLNTFVNGAYGIVEWATHVFTQETFYVIRCTINANNIQMDVNGSPHHSFLHRQNYTLITQVRFEALDNTSELEIMKIYLPQA